MKILASLAFLTLLTGVWFGDLTTLTAAQLNQVQAERAAGKSVADIAQELDVSRPVIYRAMRGNATDPS